MKKVKVAIIALLAMVLGVNSFAQSNGQTKKASAKTETIKVWGNCEMCQSKIEKASKVDGVTAANWNTKTKVLTLSYDPSKVSSDDVQKKIAAVGYDTEKFKADDKAYNGLPSCCKYDRKE